MACEPPQAQEPASHDIEGLAAETAAAAAAAACFPFTFIDELSITEL